MNARPALFDLYGDHLRRRDDEFRDQAPVAALVRLLAPLGVAAPAARTAVSRMVRQGWLLPVRLGNGPGYRLTTRAVRRLDDAAARIYRTAGLAEWDGRWHLLVLSPPPGRSGRDRLGTGLSFLGYGPLNQTTWLSPWVARAEEVDALLAAEGARAERFTANHDGDSLALVGRAWDLDGIARAYLRFFDEAAEITGTVPDRLPDEATAADDCTAPDEATVPDEANAPDEATFVARSRLVHAWRRFLFVDPGLPAALLPVDWPGYKAAEYFDAEATRLLPAASRFVEACLRPRVNRPVS